MMDREFRLFEIYFYNPSCQRNTHNVFSPLLSSEPTFYFPFLVIYDSGIMDEDYIDYLIALLLKLKEYDFKCFIDPHQDVVSSNFYNLLPSYS